MKKKAKAKHEEMLDEYDFSTGVRGKYAKRYASGTNVVLLDPDVARLYPNSESVNRALRAIAAVARGAQLREGDPNLAPPPACSRRPFGPICRSVDRPRVDS